ncbi:unnamed protein product, partial [Meganyctiphanes norvegica]
MRTKLGKAYCAMHRCCLFPPKWQKAQCVLCIIDMTGHKISASDVYNHLEGPTKKSFWQPLPYILAQREINCDNYHSQGHQFVCLPAVPGIYIEIPCKLILDISFTYKDTLTFIVLGYQSWFKLTNFESI